MDCRKFLVDFNHPLLYQSNQVFCLDFLQLLCGFAILFAAFGYFLKPITQIVKQLLHVGFPLAFEFSCIFSKPLLQQLLKLTDELSRLAIKFHVRSRRWLLFGLFFGLLLSHLLLLLIVGFIFFLELLLIIFADDSIEIELDRFHRWDFLQVDESE